MGVVNILGSFADPLNQDQGAAKLVNCRIVARKQEEQKDAMVRLVGSPGLTPVSIPAASPCIVLGQALGTIWSGHANGQIYSGVETGSPTLQGTVTVGTTPIIRMAEDRTALAIASNGTGGGGTGSGYTATLSGVAFADFQSTINFDPSTVCELDNYTIWAGASDTYANQSDKMYSSVPLDPANVPANAFATAEARADAILDVVTLGRTFWPFGTRTVEQWYDAGGSADFAFVAFTNSLIEVGLAARRTLANLHGIAMWVGTDRRIWMGKGQSGQAVSPGWVDLLLQQVDLSSLTAFMYAQGGDEFYVLTFEGSWSIEVALSNMTWCYRQTNGRSDYAGRCALEYNNGVTYIGLVTGEICKIDLTTASEPAGVMPRTAITMWIGNEETRNVIDTVDMTSYMGPSAGTFILDWSEDRLTTFKGARTITWPDPGTRRSIARAMGTARRRQLRLRYTGTTAPFEIDEMFVSLSPGL
jgi:hypothetical protein